jgi:MFS family permease
MAEKQAAKAYEAKSVVGFFGAPLSWTALFGALIGALSVIPLLFYSSGGGFTSAGMALIAPATGVLIGPWAGAIAGTIGGIIGMMISPGAYPLGFVDVILSGTLIPFSWGVMQPKFRKLNLVLWTFHLGMAYFFPYYWPAERIGLEHAKEPEWFFSRHRIILVSVMFYFFGPALMRWFESEKRTKALIGCFCVTWMAMVLWQMPWGYPYTYAVRTPYKQNVIMSYPGWITNTIPMLAVVTPVTWFLLRAVRKAKLRVIPNSWLDGYDFKWEV